LASGRGDEVEPAEEEEGETAFRDNILDLSELVREQVLLALPMNPVCEESCRGVCPKCGQNLNRGECDCEAAEEESPFGLLAQLFKEVPERKKK
jgi:uncharacterized protein